MVSLADAKPRKISSRAKMDDYDMWGYYNDNSPTAHMDSNKILELKNKIRELTSNGWPSKQAQAEVDKLEKEIEVIREKCWHDWEVVSLAQYRRKYCKKCDKEDFTYDPRKD